MTLVRAWWRRKRPVPVVVWLLLGWAASRFVVAESLWLHQALSLALIVAVVVAMFHRIAVPTRIADWCDRKTMEVHRMVDVGDPVAPEPWCLQCSAPWPCDPFAEASERLMRR